MLAYRQSDRWLRKEGHLHWVPIEGYHLIDGLILCGEDDQGEIFALSVLGEVDRQRHFHLVNFILPLGGEQ